MSFNKRSKGSGKGKVLAKGSNALTYSDGEDDMRVEVQPDATRLAFVQKHEALAIQRQRSTQQAPEGMAVPFDKKSKVADVKLDAILTFKGTERSPAGANPADLHSMLDMVLKPLEDAEQIEQADVLEVHNGEALPITSNTHHMVLLPPDQGALQTQVELCGIDEHWAPSSSNCQTTSQQPTNQQPFIPCLPGTPYDTQIPGHRSQADTQAQAANGYHPAVGDSASKGQRLRNDEHHYIGYNQQQWDGGGGYNGTQCGYDDHPPGVMFSQPQPYTCTPSQNPNNPRAPWLAYTQTAQKQPANTPAAAKRAKAAVSKSTAKRKANSQATSAIKRGNMSSQMPHLTPPNPAHHNTAKKDDRLARLLGFDMTPQIQPTQQRNPAQLQQYDNSPSPLHERLVSHQSHQPSMANNNTDNIASPAPLPPQQAASTIPTNHVITDKTNKHAQPKSNTCDMAQGASSVLPQPIAVKGDTYGAGAHNGNGTLARTSVVVNLSASIPAVANCTSGRASRRSGLAEILDEMLDDDDNPEPGLTTCVQQDQASGGKSSIRQPAVQAATGAVVNGYTHQKPAAVINDILQPAVSPAQPGCNAYGTPLVKAAANLDHTTQHQTPTPVTAHLQRLLPRNSLVSPQVDRGLTMATYTTPQRGVQANHISGSQVPSSHCTTDTRKLSDILATNDTVAVDAIGNSAADGRGVWGSLRSRRHGMHANTVSAVLKNALAAVSARQQALSQPAPSQAMTGSQVCTVQHIEHEMHIKKLLVEFAEQPGRQAWLMVNNMTPGIDRVMEGSRVAASPQGDNVSR